MTIFIVLPVHNRIDMTLEFLESLEGQDINDSIEVVIVDDGSTDGTTHRINERPNRFPIHTLNGNGKLWWGGSVWKAIKWLRPRVASEDWIFLANNDTILDRKCLAYLLETAQANLGSLVGGRSFEVWPDGTHHPVSSGFMIDTESLTVQALEGHVATVTNVDALAGRGLLIPATALAQARMHPHLMPQHFADIALTSQLRKAGHDLLVDHRAESRQIDRAGSAVELGDSPRPSLNKKSALYIPAMMSFWWQHCQPSQRPAIILKSVRIALLGRQNYRRRLE